jgi:hypothetical protein
MNKKKDSEDFLSDMDMKKLSYKIFISISVLLLIAFFVPVSNGIRSVFKLLLDDIKLFAIDYQYVFQMLAPLSLLGVLSAWIYQRKTERERLDRNLASISITNINSEAVITIQNTSGVEGTDLLIEVYKPLDFEQPYGNENFMRYVANSQPSYESKLKLLRNHEPVIWESRPVVEARFFIGEKVDFHLKDIKQGISSTETEKWVHFAPIKIIIKVPNSSVWVTRYIVFRFAHEDLRGDSDGFMSTSLHPYGSWTLIYSKNI